MPSRVIVTPVFEDADTAARLFRELATSLGADVYIVAVDDGSVKNVVDPAAIAAAGLAGVVIRLKRNMGHQRAIAVGLGYVADKFPGADVIVMDSDGEDLPQSIPALLEPLSSGAQIVVAQRRDRVETVTFKAFYAVYKLIFLLLTGRRISFGNFMALSPQGAKRLAAIPELWTHIAGSVLISRLRVAHVPLDRGPRYAGQSKMNFGGLVLHGLRALMVFAEDVLVRVGLLSGAVAVLSLLAIALTVLLKLIGVATPGWFSIALGILVLLLLQTGALTLTTLMLSGVVRNASLVAVDYRGQIDTVIEARP